MLKYSLLLTVSLVLVGSISAQKVYENRDEIPAEFKWNLNDIYSNWTEWENDLTVLKSKMDEIVSYKGKLKESSENLLKVQHLNDKLGILSYKVYRYPQLSRDLDTRDQQMGANLQKVQAMFAEFGVATSWINPEMLEIPWSTMKKWLDENPAFKPYRFGIEDLYRQQKHVLTADKEELLSYFSRVNNSPSEIYSNLTTADINFPTIALSTGDSVEATYGNYGLVLATNRNQEDRKKIYEAHYGVFKENENTFASIYSAICQSDWATARARGYNSSLEAVLDGNNIPIAVYENLVNTVKANTEPLKKYNSLRKKLLKLDKYYNFDGSIPITDFLKTYSYDEAKEQVLASITPLGSDYKEKITGALKGGWIDVFENKGKRAGAYSAGVYGVHPYMLMNYNGTLDNVFTLGHELGHTMHTLYSQENQPFSTSSYTIFVAEVASTFNERLLLDHMLSKTTDPKERINLLQQAIQGITGTFYFQTLLADYELQVHTLVEKGESVTAATLTKIMSDLYDAYYGNSIEKDEFVNRVWTRIPHMYRTPFYVYQYATCFASSAQIYKNINTGTDDERKAAKEKYLELLKSGGSNYPMEQLKNAGVDLTQPETIKAVIAQFSRLVDELEAEIDKLN
jgi:oligoendopeptidase F